MGGFIAPSTKIGGTEVSPGIPLASTPFSGLHQTDSGGIGIALAGEDHSLLDAAGWKLGPRDAPDYALSQVAGSPFAAGVNPGYINSSTDGIHVAVVNRNSNNVDVFSRNTMTGFLTRIVGSPFATGLYPGYVKFSPDGAHVAVTNAVSNTVTVFSRNATTGFLTEIVGSPFAVGMNSAGLDISPDGAHVAVTNYVDNTVTVFSRNATTGFLTEIVGSPFATGLNPQAVAFSPDGAYVAVVNISNNVSVFSRNATTGFLTEISGSPFAAGLKPRSITFSPDGANISVTNYADNNITVFATNSAGSNLNLIDATFGADGNGLFNVNGVLRVLGDTVPHMSDNDARYAKLAGLSTQVFDVAAGAGTQAVNKAQADATYAKLAGLSTQVFNVAAGAGTQAVNKAQADAAYAKLAGLPTQVFSAKGFKGSEAVNASQGIATLVDGTVTVANTSITANSRILITPQETGVLTGILRVSARAVGASFTISSSVATDTAAVCYEIFEPA